MTIKTTRKKATSALLFVGQSTEDVPVTDDFVDDVLRVVRALVPEMSSEQAHQAAVAVRDRWGGDRPYIARRPGEGRSVRNEQIRREYLRGERLEFLARRHGMTPRRVLQIVKGG